MISNLGFILLALWLILGGLMTIIGLNFAGEAVLMAILAIFSGVLILLGR